MKRCTNCGTDNRDEARFCGSCGTDLTSPAATPAVRPAYVPAAPVRRTEGLAVAALVLGILGIVACPVVPSILALVFGNQAMTKIGADPTLEGDTLAKAGIITGWIGLGVWALIIVAGVGAAVLSVRSF